MADVEMLSRNPRADQRTAGKQERKAPGVPKAAKREKQGEARSSQTVD